MSIDIFDRNGQPMSRQDWYRKLSDMDYKVIAKTNLPDGRQVSTVWLGLDHSYGGPPLIFETMVFRDHIAVDGIQERYSTEAEARIGHMAIFDELAKAAPQRPEEGGR